MKKYLSLISTFTFITTSSLNVIACDHSKESLNLASGAENANIKQWCTQTSNIAKALILSKNENFNTNRLLNTILNKSDNNIKNDENNLDSGFNFECFKNNWGYKNKIKGITEKDFISNTDKAIDNDQITTKNNINETINLIKIPIKHIANFPSKKIINNVYLNILINEHLKNNIADMLWLIKDKSKIINEIMETIPFIYEIINNIDAFNPEKILNKHYVSGNITESLFGKNGNGGWLKNYKTSTNFTSEAVTKNSSILKAENFKTWNQVAFLKSSIDLNSFFSSLTENKISLGDIFNSAIKYDNKIAVDFDIKKFTNEITTIWNSNINIKNIIKLISILIPIIKYQIFEIKPTTPISKISNIENTNKEQGIINIKDIISSIENIILTKDGFTNFITKLFFIKSEGQFSLNNYATFDFICEKNKTLSETLVPIKEKMIINFDNIYTKNITPELKKIYVPDIFNKIKEELENLNLNFEFKITEIKELLDILNNTLLFFEKIINYENKETMLEEWEDLWKTLGLQKNDKIKFIKDSVLEKLINFLETKTEFLNNLNNLLKSIMIVSSNSIDFLVDKETTAKIDFNNEKLWLIDEKTIKYAYNQKLNETIISYNLIDKTKLNTQKTYKIVVVIQGNANNELGTIKQQVWLKEFSEEKNF